MTIGSIRRSALTLRAMTVAALAGCSGGGGGGGAGVTVTVHPSSASLDATTTLQLSATVSGASGAVAWSVDHPRCGSVDASGLYAAPLVAPVAPCLVRAASVAAPEAAGTATLTVLPRTRRVAGTVSYGGTRRGRLHVAVAWGAAPSPSAVAGTSLAAPGPFAIDGVVSTGTATVMAWIDVLGTGRYVPAVDPFGARTVQISARITDVGTLLLADPAASAPAAPPLAQAHPGDGFTELAIGQGTDGRGFEAAGAYRIYWSTTPSPGPSNTLGLVEVPAGTTRAQLAGLSSSVPLYLAISAVAGASESAATSVTPSPLTLGSQAPPGALSIRGEISFPPGAGTPTVLARHVASGRVYPARASGATSPASYAVAVESGAYELFAYLDAASDGIVGPGDPSLLDAPGARVTMAGADVAAPPLAIPDAPATARATSHVVDGLVPLAWVELLVRSGTRRPVRAALLDGPALLPPLDLPVANRLGVPYVELGGAWSVGEAIPAPGDLHALEVEYDDGSSETLPAEVTYVATRPPVPAAPRGVASSATPTLQWSAPSPVPAGPYRYTVTLSDLTGPLWISGAIPAPQTAVVYDGLPLAAGVEYGWTVRVEDAHGNTGTSDVATFTIP